MTSMLNLASFKFWMLIRLLTPELLESAEDMVANRHRLNAVIIRRTKADACAQDGSPLFARRVVHTEAFNLSAPEKEFYNHLLEYLRDGYNLAAQQGNKGRALGFVMSIFQKIAASSFAAIRSTLKRRFLMLTLQESIERDELLDVDERNRLLAEARQIIHQVYSVPFDAVGKAQVEQILAESKFQLLKKRKDALNFVKRAESYSDSEFSAASGEESAALLVSLALPEERFRIQDLLNHFPEGAETKTEILIHALSQIWAHNPNEKVVIFATYLGTVATIKMHLDQAFPNGGVDILKGGDHGAKTALHRKGSKNRMGRMSWYALLPDVKASTFSLPGCFLIMTCHGIPWTWNRESVAYTGMDSILPPRPITSLRQIPSKVKFSCFWKKNLVISLKPSEK